MNRQLGLNRQWRLNELLVGTHLVPITPLSVKLQQVVRPSAQSAQNIQAILDLPASERSFHSEATHSATHSSATAMSGYSKDAPKIILDDIDILINIKKEGSQDAPKSSSFVPTPKTVRASSIKKRKTIEPSPFDGLDPDQIPAKMLSLVTLVALCHAELQQAAHDKNFYINNLQRDLDNLKGELAATKLRHAEELARFKDGTKQSIAVLVLQARIKMALEAQDASFDRSSWNVDGWIKRLEELRGQAVEGVKKDPVAETPADPEGKGKVVAEGGGAPAVVTQGNEDVIDKV